MRRARIKATVTVPTRRKATQDGTPAETPVTPAITTKKEAPKITHDTLSITEEVLSNDFPRSVPEKEPVQVQENTLEEAVKPDSFVAPDKIKQSPLKSNEAGTVQISDDRDSNDHTQVKPVSEESWANLTDKEAAVPSLNFSYCEPQPEQTFQNEDPSTPNKNNFETETIRAVTQVAESPSKAQIASPTKIPQSRLCFTKPTPRLDTSARMRRNSVQGSGASASESEDDTRRNTEATLNRPRNDSVCSTYSVKSTAPPPVVNQPKTITKQRTAPKRRMMVSESARKLAEARREFLLKHENKTPDRSKLTMYDLIYYNPVTNPMKKSRDSTLARKISVCSTEEPREEEEEENENDPSSAMPVPQVKVGPDGQLIVDEQSLVIEQTNVKKSKELASKEAIIDDDNTGNGFYKRRQKSKEWPKWETLKFYKALNTVGTDFLLMQSLFPKRTRQEIKQKFKKEEKVNRHLVEKALAYHQEFDTDLLEQSLASFEDFEREYVSAQELKENKKKVRSERKRACRFVATSIAEMEASDEDDPGIADRSSQGNEEQNNNKDSNGSKKVVKRGRRKRLKMEQDSTELAQSAEMGEPLSPSDSTEPVEGVDVDDDGVDVQSGCSVSDSDSEIYHVRPTRSGRQPKVKKLQAPNVSTMDDREVEEGALKNISILPEMDINEENAEQVAEIPQDAETTEALRSVIPDISQVEPGSLVILSKESTKEPGKSVLQVYMVSKNIGSENQLKPNITPIDLSPELLATVTTKISNVEPISMKEELE